MRRFTAMRFWRNARVSHSPVDTKFRHVLTYWTLFLMPFLAALGGGDRTTSAGRKAPASIYWLLFGTAIFVAIGFRYQVGGDWFNYLRHFDDMGRAGFWDVLFQSDPGYKLLNWIAAALDWGIFGVNAAAALIFSIGLLAFCRNLPRPWLGAAVAVPYLVIVVAMGYTRQGVALGFAMLGLLALERGSTKWFVIWVILGATFHRSALLLLPIGALAATKNRIWAAMWIGAVGLVGYQALLERDVEALYENYVERQYRSEGALLRLLMNGFAAGILLSMGKRFRLSASSALLWRWFAVLALLLLLAYFAAPTSSAALDRLGLYLLPLQVMVFAHLPDAMGKRNGSKSAWVAMVLLYYALVLFVWLTFGRNAYAWLPYQIYLFGVLI